MNNYAIIAEKREELGKRSTRRLRATERVPVIVYGAGKAPASLSVVHDTLMRNLDNEAFYANILTLEVDGGKEKVVLKAVQRHPSRPRILHVDFQRISADQQLRMHVPLHFMGEDVAPGIKQGGAISHQMTDVEISCLPADLPEFLEVDVSNMDVGETLHLSDIKVTEGVEIPVLAQGEDHNLPIATLHAKQAEESIDDAEVDTGAAEAEGE